MGIKIPKGKKYMWINGKSRLVDKDYQPPPEGEPPKQGVGTIYAYAIVISFFIRIIGGDALLGLAVVFIFLFVVALTNSAIQYALILKEQLEQQKQQKQQYEEQDED